LTGSFTIDTTFNNVPRVTVIIPTPVATLAFQCSFSSDGSHAKVIELDGNFVLNAGTLTKQDPAALTAANPAGTYVFGLDSDIGTVGVVSGRIVEAGQFVLGAGGTSVTGGVADASQAGGPGSVFGGALSGAAPLDAAAASATAPDASGRGTLTLSYAGFVAQYAYYIVNAQQLNIIQLGGGGTLLTVQSGTAHIQNTLTANSINGTGVVGLTGIDIGQPLSDVIIGVLSITGNTSTTTGTTSVTFDTNRSGVRGISQTTTGQFFTPFDPTTGRCVIQNLPTIATNFVGATLIYLYDDGKGYVIDGTPNNGAGAVNHAFSGMLTPQAAGPFSLAADFTGNVIALGGGSSSSSIPNVDMAFNLTGAAGTYSAIFDLTTPNTAIGANGQVVGFQIADLYAMDDPVVGHAFFHLLGGVLGDPNTGADDLATIYIIGPNQFVAIGVGPGAGGGVPSGVLFFDPQ
jgi:hypothetical protein